MHTRLQNSGTNTLCTASKVSSYNWPKSQIILLVLMEKQNRTEQTVKSTVTGLGLLRLEDLPHHG